MVLSIKDPETERLARALADQTGETITLAIRRALEERLRRVGSNERKAALLEDLAAIRRRWAALPVLDGRSADEISAMTRAGFRADCLVALAEVSWGSSSLSLPEAVVSRTRAIRCEAHGRA
jgi:antitoxin VapB